MERIFSDTRKHVILKKKFLNNKEFHKIKKDHLKNDIFGISFKCCRIVIISHIYDASIYRDIMQLE